MDPNALSASPSPASQSDAPLPDSEPQTPIVSLSRREGDDTMSDSQLTSSDKLTALPPSSPPINTRTSKSGTIRAPRMDASQSLPSFASSKSAQDSLSSSPFPGGAQRASASDGSLAIGRDSPNSKQRVSFESDRTPGPSRQGFIRSGAASDSAIPTYHTSPSPLREPSSANNTRPNSSTPNRVTTPPILNRSKPGTESPPTLSLSRTHSPFRRLQQSLSHLHRHHSREEPFIPIDPFKLRIRFADFRAAHHLGSLGGGPSEGSFVPDCDYDCTQGTCCGIPLPGLCSPKSSPHVHTFQTFFMDTLPRQVYLHMLLRLPSLYFARVARVFEDAEVSRPDVQHMIDAFSVNGVAHSLPFPDEWGPPSVSPALVRFKASWEEFIDSVLREWKTLNVVSALLLSAILTMFQIPKAADDPVVRIPALLSLICALMSLSYGCIYIVRFGTMRNMQRASKWAEAARKMNTTIWWNVWVFLAMPGVWLAWSMICFIIAILAFVWRTGSTSDPQDYAGLSPGANLAPRIAITAVFALGFLYFGLIVVTLKQYGSAMSARERAAARALWTSPTPREQSRERVFEANVSEPTRGRERERTRATPTPTKRPHEPERLETLKEMSGLRDVAALDAVRPSVSSPDDSGKPHGSLLLSGGSNEKRRQISV